MSRFYCLPEEVKKNQIVIEQRDEIHHIADVMRQAEGDKVVVFDGSGKQYKGSILNISKQKIIIDIESITGTEESSLKLTLACAIPKKNKFDFIIQKAVELGADEIIPVITERTIVRLDKNKSSARIKRWQKISKEAAKQSGRLLVPKIPEVSSFKDAVLQVGNYGLALISHLSDERKDLRDLDLSGVKSAIIFIGPEGDFTSSEINLAVKSGCFPVSLGRNVLKVETAAIFSVGMLSYLLKKI